MPEYIRSLVVIFTLSIATFSFARPFVGTLIGTGDFTLRRNLWFTLTLAIFLTHSFWLYTLIAIPLLIYARKKESNPPALFFFILFVMPMAYVSIPGVGLINYFFELSHARILALFILLPAWFSLLNKSDIPTFGRTTPDKVLAAYLLLTALLFLRETSVTDTLRHVFYLFTDAFLPYFVISRSLKNLHTFRDALLSIVLAIMVLAPLAVFEFFKHWLLYASVTSLPELKNGMTGYLGRDGMLRAVATAGQPIALGYLMAVGMGLYLFLQRSIQKKLIRRLGITLLAAGLIAPMSRGPWVGTAVMLVVFISTGPFALRRLVTMAMAAIFFLSIISVLPGGEKIVNLLPFVGKTEKSTIDYRENLITNSIIVIKRNPWFGSVDYLNTPELEAMRNGRDGIIDIVNTYIAVALEIGLAGAGLFVSFFALVLVGTYRATRSIPDKDSEERLLGRALLATLIAIMVTIFTVSSISVIPIVYWSVAGLCVAYAQMVRKNIEISQ